MIGKLNLEVCFSTFTAGLSANNTPVRVPAIKYFDWVKIEQLNSSRSLDQAQIQYSVAYKITKRHYPERPVNIQLTEIEYADKILSIHSIKLIEEGRRSYEEFICYANNGTT